MTIMPLRHPLMEFHPQNSIKIALSTFLSCPTLSPKLLSQPCDSSRVF